jgi:nucleoside-diphosphate-sugar epimerase
MNGKGNVIIGASSALSRSIAKVLAEQNEPVRALIRNKQKAQKLYSDLPNVELIEGDAYNRSDVENALKDASMLYYCVNVPYPQWKKEVRELLSVSIGAALKHKAKLVFPGNVYVYGHAKSNPVKENHPFTAHTRKGKIRIEMEQMLSDAAVKSGLKYTIVRMPDFYGPYVINGFSEKIFVNALRGEKLQWVGDLDIPIEFIFIEDAGKAMVLAGSSDKSNGRMFNVPGANITTARAFLHEVMCQSKKGSKIATISFKFIIAFAGLFNSMIREFREMMYLKQETFLLDGALFKATFGTIPATPYREGIKKTLEWAKEFLQEGPPVEVR